MIRAWLNLSSLGIFTSLIAIYAGMALLLATVAFKTPLSRRVQMLSGVVAPFFGSVAVLFALLTGFLANDVSDRSRQAFRSVQMEAGELHNLHTLSVAAASDMRPIRAALKTYVTSVIADEWPAMDETRPSAKTVAAYDDLLREVSNPALARGSGSPVHAALLNSALRIGTARNDRLALSADHTNDLKWLVVILLGLVTQVAIALVHLDKPRAFLATQTVFATAVIVALGTIALQEYPFYGVFRVSNAPIAALQSLSD